jgi:hypothetical protein
VRHWWNRTPEEQDAIARWVRGEAPPPLLVARQAREQEKLRYARHRALKLCACGGTGRMAARSKTNPTEAITCPCPYCRAASHEAWLASADAAALRGAAAAAR